MSIERLNVLRERNRHLLELLRQQREQLERLCGCSEREDEAEETATLTGAARAKPSVKFIDNRDMQRGAQKPLATSAFTSNYSEGTVEHTTLSDLVRGGNRQDTGPLNIKSCIVNHSKEQTEVRSRVTFQSECEDTPDSERHRLPPLLGYDWIAGVLDTEDSLIERSDEFFNDLFIFRSLNKDECVHSAQTEFSEAGHPVTPLLTDRHNPEANADTHQCTFSYRINSRLFPMPLHSQECCPVCKKHKSTHPHTFAEPALIRVSIPCTRLLPPYKYKAHRRCSFDSSDSLGLPSHCLSGWSNTGQSTLPPPSSLDLRSSVHTKHSTGSSNKELEDLSAPERPGKHDLDQISDLRCLARYNFQHFSPKRKLGGIAHPPYPLC